MTFIRVVLEISWVAIGFGAALSVDGPTGGRALFLGLGVMAAVSLADRLREEFADEDE